MLPRVTFSTLACPHWSRETVIANAQAMGYDGIEWRGGAAGHINPSASREDRKKLREQVRDANLFSLAVTGYTSFTSNNPQERAENVEELKRTLDLAADLDAGFVRVFVGECAPQQTIPDMYPRIIESLEQCIPHARSVGVGMAIEHHDDFVHTSSIVPILARLNDPSIGALWDVANAYSTGETVEEAAQDLRHRVLYVHVKDGVGHGEDWRLTNLGEGDVYLRQAMQLLRAQNFEGSFSIEWEYAWHPELEPPERALPHGLEHVRGLVKQVFGGQEP